MEEKPWRAFREHNGGRPPMSLYYGESKLYSNHNRLAYDSNLEGYSIHNPPPLVKRKIQLLPSSPPPSNYGVKSSQPKMFWREKLEKEGQLPSDFATNPQQSVGSLNNFGTGYTSAHDLDQTILHGDRNIYGDEAHIQRVDDQQGSNVVPSPLATNVQQSAGSFNNSGWQNSKGYINWTGCTSDNMDVVHQGTQEAGR
ncbi:hypothetical protein O6P43_020090 [Quillaja saponaria]|uniref:Uncharacterized protein n=1 Tax=Quillaja saponaria TaxID=32244 RepID=A0AAD7LJW8_QUISA|nr:hypothetical protein O6P43_020090 [Quillaja saponaria]